MKAAARILVSSLAALGVCAGARAANSFSNDVTDLWWNPNESGWGVNLIQQSNILFATFFVYDATGQAHWYVAPDMESPGAPTDQPYGFRGVLYETTGPAFSAASFAASAVTRREVGSVFFQFVPPNSGHITYTVDGVTVDKAISRQTWTALDMTGRYYGGTYTAKDPFPSAASCTPRTGTQVFDDISVTQSGTSVSITASLGDPPQELCRYTGTFSQAGHMGQLAGAYSCNSGVSGTFILSEIEVGITGMSARYGATVAGCPAIEAVNGNFAAMRKQ
jgi:hypothetical protein